MAYTMVDLIDKLILIEQKGSNVYRIIAYTGNHVTSLRNAAAVLARDEERHVEYYTELKERLKEYPGLEIGFDLYDLASGLLHTFKRQIAMPDVEDVQALLMFAKNLEEENIALIKNIQGRLVNHRDDVGTMAYKVLGDILAQEETHIKNLESFLEK